jgi:hypothetical protein
MRFILLLCLLISCQDNKEEKMNQIPFDNMKFFSLTDLSELLQKMHDNKVDENAHLNILKSIAYKINPHVNWCGYVIDHDNNIDVGDAVELYIFEENNKILEISFYVRDSKFLNGESPQFQGGYANIYEEDSKQVRDVYYDCVKALIKFDSLKIDINEYKFQWMNNIQLELE